MGEPGEYLTADILCTPRGSPGGYGSHGRGSLSFSDIPDSMQRQKHIHQKAQHPAQLPHSLDNDSGDSTEQLEVVTQPAAGAA